MPFVRKRPDLKLLPDVREKLEKIARSRTEPARRVERAGMILAYADGESISSIARRFHTNRPKVERCIDKALQIGAIAALNDLPGRGRKPTISAEARAWLVSIACRKPTELGYPHERWTTALLAKHVRQHCVEAGYPCLQHLARGTVSKILAKQKVRPHKTRYYLERRDPEFERKMIDVLCVYREVKLLRQNGVSESPVLAYVCYDEKPGIQVLESVGRELPPVPGRYPAWARDHHYKRHGTMSLLAGIDLLTGHIHAKICDRHRSKEFIEFLKQIDAHYPPQAVIRIVLDNHSAHVSKETRRYLASVPNRFDFVFTPKHGLSLIHI